MKAQDARLRHSAAELEAKGREVYEDTIKTGRKVLAGTPSELRTLGLAAMQGKLPEVVGRAVVKEVAKRVPQAPPKSRAPTSGARAPQKPQSGNLAKEAKRQVMAGVSGAADEFTFGLADPVLAATDAVLHTDPTKADVLKDLRQQYDASIAKKRADDAYDAVHYGAALNTGRVVGFAGSLMATGGFGAGGVLARVAPRAVKAVNATKRIAELTPGGLNALTAAGGAASGVVGQAISDGLSGHRSSFGDYVGAAGGGALGALTMRVGVPGAGRATQAAARVVRDPRVAGAADGASTTALQASLNGEDASFEDIAESARAGAVSAGVGDLVGKYGSNALPNRGKGLTKEQVGETLSIAKSIASGDGRPWGRTIPEFNAILPKVKGPARQVDVPLSRTYTKADHVTHKAIAVESKFGPYARLTDPQGLARLELPAGHYRVDHWLPSDAGRIVSALFAAPGSHWEGGEGEWR